jgi:predicted RNA methylase
MLRGSMPDDYYASYSDPAVHRTMIGDHARTEAFRRAIEEVVRPGDTVLDIGTGTGILSFFAARAGAERVYAVDNSSIIDLARRLAVANGLDDKIQFHGEPIETAPVEEQVNVIVSEWLGFFALTETMFKSFVKGRDRLLAPGGTTIPSAVHLFLAPMESADFHVREGPGFWERPVYGFDFTEMVKYEVDNFVTTSRSISQSAYLAEPTLLVEIDCVKDPVDAFFFDCEVEMVIERTGTMHGFAGHFDAVLSPSVTLSTSPFAEWTHWRQSFFPIRAVHVEKGDRVSVKMRATNPMDGDRRLPIYFLDCAIHRGDVQTEKFFYCHHASCE